MAPLMLLESAARNSNGTGPAVNIVGNTSKYLVVLEYTAKPTGKENVMTVLVDTLIDTIWVNAICYRSAFGSQAVNRIAGHVLGSGGTVEGMAINYDCIVGTCRPALLGSKFKVRWICEGSQPFTFSVVAYAM